jgi:hypothetical protein
MRSAAEKPTLSSTASAHCSISSPLALTIRPPQGVLESAYMAIALPLGGALKKPIDEALVGITASQE